MVQWFSYKRSVFSVRMTHSEYGLGHESAELKGETQAEGTRAMLRLQNQIREQDIATRVTNLRTISDTGLFTADDLAAEETPDGTQPQPTTTPPVPEEEELADYGISDHEDDGTDEKKAETDAQPPQQEAQTVPFDEMTELPELYPHEMVYRTLMKNHNCKYASGDAGTITKHEWE